MYGFHKGLWLQTCVMVLALLTRPTVSDVFHTGNPDTALWEFKHGNGSFKRGDLVGLREIKRRASRHALVHREYPNQKPSPSQPGTPAEPMPMPQDPGEARIEYTIHDMEMRLRRSEESAHYMHVKQQALMETMTRLLHFNQELSRAVLSLVPGPDNPIHRDGKHEGHSYALIHADTEQSPLFSRKSSDTRTCFEPWMSPSLHIRAEASTLPMLIMPRFLPGSCRKMTQEETRCPFREPGDRLTTTDRLCHRTCP
jgi:hypothetical protein